MTLVKYSFINYLWGQELVSIFHVYDWKLSYIYRLYNSAFINMLYMWVYYQARNLVPQHSHSFLLSTTPPHSTHTLTSLLHPTGTMMAEITGHKLEIKPGWRVYLVFPGQNSGGLSLPCTAVFYKWGLWACVLYFTSTSTSLASWRRLFL